LTALPGLIPREFITVPDWKDHVRRNLAPLQLGPERELEMVDEMAQHLETVYDEAIANGASEQEAFKLAASHIRDWRLLECELIRAKRPIAGAWLNPNSLTRRDIQDQRRTTGGLLMGSLLHDLRFSARMLLKNKTFTAVAVLSLALGIGANTAIFSLVDAVLLKTLPVKKPHELVLFRWISGRNFMAGSISGSLDMNYNGTSQSSSTSFSFDTYKRLRESSETLTSLLAFAEVEQLNLNIDGQAEIASGQVVSGNYYEGLGISPIIGRAITVEDDRPAADPVAVISYRYWQRRFGGDPQAVGRSVYVNGHPFTIIGVSPRGFEGTLQVGSSPDMSMALAAEPQIRALSGSVLNDPGTWWLQIIGRLNPGSTMEQTRANLEGAFQQSAIEGHQYALAHAKEAREEGGREQPDIPTLMVEPGGHGLTEMRNEYTLSLGILMTVVGLVLLIACANVATLLLSRTAGRQRDIAVRLALGASRWRVIRQLMTESVLLAILGGALGLLLAVWCKDLLLTLRPWGSGQLQLELRMDLRVLLFTSAVSVITGVLFGSAPALRCTRLELAPALKDSNRSVIVGGRFGLVKTLVIVQVAMSLFLLIGAGLFVRTLEKLHRVDIGFNADNLLLFRVDPRLSGYKKEQIADLYERMLDRIRGVPCVVGATISRHPLLSGSAAISQAFVDGEGGSNDGSVLPGRTWILRVRPNFFETMEIPIIAGRALTEADDERAPKVAVISQAMARRHFGDDNPIGRRFGFGSPESSREIEIVGVAADASYSSIRMEKPNTAYIPYAQDRNGLGQMSFAVRTTGDPASLSSAIRSAVAQVDPNLPLFEVKTQVGQLEESLTSERMFAALSSFFGVLALLLSCLGLYGVMSYAVARRRNEIGIRMALGATSPRVSRMVMRESMVLVLIGMAIGLGAALAAARVVSSLLFGLTPTDPVTILCAVLLMTSVAALAGYLPARRASQVDPLVSLRCE
jgi:predicted permease